MNKIFSMFLLLALPPGRNALSWWLVPRFGMASIWCSAHSLDLFLRHSCLNLRWFYLVVLGLEAPLSSPLEEALHKFLLRIYLWILNKTNTTLYVQRLQIKKRKEFWANNLLIYNCLHLDYVTTVQIKTMLPWMKVFDLTKQTHRSRCSSKNVSKYWLRKSRPGPKSVWSRISISLFDMWATY